MTLIPLASGLEGRCAVIPDWLGWILLLAMLLIIIWIKETER